MSSKLFKKVYIMIEVDEDSLDLFKKTVDFLKWISRQYKVGFKIVSVYIRNI